VAVDLYLSIPGLTDEPGAQDTGTATIDSVQYLQISTFAFSVAGQQGQSSGASGAGAGKVQFSPFSITLPVDKATPQLFQACSAGKVFPTATVLVRDGGSGPAPTTQQYAFRQVVVQSLAVSVSADSDQQSVSFGYGSLSISYTPVTAQGQPGAPVSAGWDLATNQAV